MLDDGQVGSNPRGRKTLELYRARVVVRFNNTKGYGFIGREDGPDIFVHHTAMVAEGYKILNGGDRVEFEIVQGAKGRTLDPRK